MNTSKNKYLLPCLPAHPTVEEKFPPLSSEQAASPEHHVKGKETTPRNVPILIRRVGLSSAHPNQ